MTARGDERWEQSLRPSRRRAALSSPRKFDLSPQYPSGQRDLGGGRVEKKGPAIKAAAEDPLFFFFNAVSVKKWLKVNGALTQSEAEERLCPAGPRGTTAGSTAQLRSEGSSPQPPQPPRWSHYFQVKRYRLCTRHNSQKVSGWKKIARERIAIAAQRHPSVGLFNLTYFILFLLSFDFAAFFPHYFSRGFCHFLYWNALEKRKNIWHLFSPFFVYTYFYFISLSFFFCNFPSFAR